MKLSPRALAPIFALSLAASAGSAFSADGDQEQSAPAIQPASHRAEMSEHKPEHGNGLIYGGIAFVAGSILWCGGCMVEGNTLIMQRTYKAWKEKHHAHQQSPTGPNPS